MITAEESMAYLCALAHLVPGVVEECQRRGLPLVPRAASPLVSNLAAALLHRLFQFPLMSKDIEPYIGFIDRQPVWVGDLLIFDQPKVANKGKVETVKPEVKEEDLDFFL